MELLHLRAQLASGDRLVELVNEQTSTVVLDVVDADTVVVAGALREQWSKPLGVWLHVSPDYPAQLAARDVATLSWLVELDHVVIEATNDAEAHADVVRALLTDEEVNFTNGVASLVKAYNRPAPPRELRVWSLDGDVLGDGGETLSARDVRVVTQGELTRFASS